MEAALTGASAGDELEVDVPFPEEHRPEELAGKTGKFAVTVKEVREKQLPDLDDDFASEASEFDTLDELKGEIAARIRVALEERAEAEFSEAAVDAATDAAQVDVPEEIVNARAEEMLDRFLHNLSHRGVDPDAFLKVQEGGREGMLSEIRKDAERNLRREAVLAAIADAESIEVSDEDLVEALGPGEGDSAPERILARLRDNDRIQLLRDEVRLRKAAQIVTQTAKPIPLDRAAARERLWTPEKETAEAPEGQAEPGLWTPGS
jgi:trigger factor